MGALYLARGSEGHGPRGRSGAVDVSGSCAHADLIEPAVEDVGSSHEVGAEHHRRVSQREITSCSVFPPAVVPEPPLILARLARDMLWMAERAVPSVVSPAITTI